MRIERELMRGAGPVAVLKLLQSGPMYGYELIATLDTRSGGVLDMGQSTLYPMLYNLEAKGLIKSAWREGSVDGGDGSGSRPRKYYALTDKGRRRLAADTRQWQHLAKAMTALGIIGSEPAAQPRGATA
jgi:PadR family transcriptional regulator, regulatory protein PadR